MGLQKRWGKKLWAFTDHNNLMGLSSLPFRNRQVSRQKFLWPTWSDRWYTCAGLTVTQASISLGWWGGGGRMEETRDDCSRSRASSPLWECSGRWSHSESKGPLCRGWPWADQQPPTAKDGAGHQPGDTLGMKTPVPCSFSPVGSEACALLVDVDGRRGRHSHLAGSAGPSAWSRAPPPRSQCQNSAGTETHGDCQVWKSQAVCTLSS